MKIDHFDPPSHSNPLAETIGFYLLLSGIIFSNFDYDSFTFPSARDAFIDPKRS